MRTAHGATMARQSRTVLRGALQLAVLANVLGTNPAHDVSSIKSKNRPQGAPGTNRTSDLGIRPPQFAEVLILSRYPLGCNVICHFGLSLTLAKSR
jgi:hypothetical protein